MFLMFLFLSIPVALGSWLYFSGENAVDGCGMQCSSTDPKWKCLGNCNSVQQCENLCSQDVKCSIMTFSSTTGNCWARYDGLWNPISASGTTAGCDTSSVKGCQAPPPYSGPNVTFSIGGEIGVPLHPLAPAVALDFWLATDPTYGEKWQSSGILTIDLTNKDLIKYSSALSPAILRIGGSPEDSIIFDTDGSCTPGGTGPSQNYYCSQVRPYTYGCLSPTRWEEILAFADLVGFKIAFGLNGCYGRESANSPMNFSNAQELMVATANSQHAGALLFWELSNEVVPNTINANQWVADVSNLKKISDEIFTSKGLNSPAFVGPDQGGSAVSDVVTALNKTSGALAAVTYHQYPQCVAPSVGTPFALLPSCLNQLPSAALGYSTTTSAISGLQVWSGESADHSGGGIPGLTDTFRSSFYYATQIGSLPAYGVELMARQCLSGGDYELLQRFANASFAPNPDYFVLWLTRGIFKQGAHTFNVSSSAPPTASGLQIFAFEASSSFSGMTALLIINSHTDNTYYLTQSFSEETQGGTRTEWHMTGDLTAVHGPVFINGRAMLGDLPADVTSIGVSGIGSEIIVKPSSIVFVTV
jgi:heparanase 1